MDDEEDIISTFLMFLVMALLFLPLCNSIECRIESGQKNSAPAERY